MSARLNYLFLCLGCKSVIVLVNRKFCQRVSLITKMDSKTTPVVAAAAGHQVTRGITPVGRGVPEAPEAYTKMKKCSCEREKTIVFCRGCGYYCHGRIRLKCEQHPRITFLLDITECPQCHSVTFLDEYLLNV